MTVTVCDSTVSTVPYEYDIQTSRGPTTVVLKTDPTGKFGAGQGATVWDSALCLAKYIEKRAKREPHILHGARVIEIGSGTGLVGLVFAALGGGSSESVTLTDTPNALRLLRRNVDHMAKVLKDQGLALPALSSAALTWGSENDATALRSSDPQPPTHVLVSDCLYVPSLYSALLGTLDAVCGPETTVWIAYEKRDFPAEMEFWKSFGERFRFSNIPEAEQDEMYRSEDIFLFEARRRSSPKHNGENSR
ncbi:Methyltransferase-like protein 21D [Geranomyces variabilis]|uniref:Methyltransferase-like protein 21D n=1 Tax=Geranomyces variabilis TaxID=109894 RepID=A0AAD5TSS4_9FUNG|nr:Methyltransferase-like protein 21D [Geranomyces variabilis]